MPTAYVLVRVELGDESETLENLRKIDAVEEAYRVYGDYDTIVKIRADTMDKLREIVAWKVRRVDKVQSTLTLIVMELKKEGRLSSVFPSLDPKTYTQ